MKYDEAIGIAEDILFNENGGYEAMAAIVRERTRLMERVISLQVKLKAANERIENLEFTVGLLESQF